MPTNQNLELKAALFPTGLRSAKVKSAALDRSREPNKKKPSVVFKNVAVKSNRGTRRKYKFGFSPS